mgnify:CR=1 FL=1
MSVVFVAASQLPTPFGVFTMHGFLETASGKEHVALTYGDVADGEPVLVLDDSPCVQVVARKPDGDPVASAREAERLRNAAPRISYGQQWTTYFDAIVADEAEARGPFRLVALLSQRPADDGVANMFRAWIFGAWQTRPDWGPVPAGLEPSA